MSYIPDLLCEIVFMRDLLNQFHPETHEWYQLAFMRRRLLEFYAAVDPYFRDSINSDPTTVICVFTDSYVSPLPSASL